ncbi:ArsR/SmtB family transcription factor [Streptomyces fulvoviolaceus]|uniref:ArsR/SmtB family transcription factor n=1 Tax=Streptomyces fulvoviolaceus TaxID=285535 RepID=UPI00099704D3|nr:winged helix-turn-helix domain-containing protein [Streptomyces fulvoviolaceus]
MLRIHFTAEDLARIRVASTPDPLWEITFSLHRLQTSQGRWAYADWHRSTRATLTGTRLGAAVRRVLIPVLPRARYWPDFLSPDESADGLERGLAAILDTPPTRVAQEVGLLARSSGAPDWALRLTERGSREELVRVLRAYHEAVVAPHHDRMCESLAGERVLLSRATLDGGVGGLLTGLSPAMRWCPPVLHVDYVEDRDLNLGGRGLRLVPSYFCWQSPVSLADDTLRPVLVYPVHGSRLPAPACPEASLSALLGRTRAAALRTLALGATTSELARFLGVSPATATHHTTVLRDAGLITSRRAQNTMLHALTPLGAAMLRRPSPGPRAERDAEKGAEKGSATAVRSDF